MKVSVVKAKLNLIPCQRCWSSSQRPLHFISPSKIYKGGGFIPCTSRAQLNQSLLSVDTKEETEWETPSSQLGSILLTH